MDTATLPPDDGMIENRTFDEIAIGDSASLSHRLTEQDIELFALVSGDVNPAHLDPAYAETGLFHKIIGHGMWSGSLISAVLGTRLPGPGTIYLSQDLRFRAPVGLGDTITATVTAREKKPEKKRVVFDCACTEPGRDAGGVRHRGGAGADREGAPAAHGAAGGAAQPPPPVPRAAGPCPGRAAGAGRRGASLRHDRHRRGGGGRRRRAGDADPGGAGGEDPRRGRDRRGRHRRLPPGAGAAQPRRRGTGRGAGARGRGRDADEGLAAHRRADARGGGGGDRAAHRAAPEPRLHHGRAHLPAPPDGDRRRGEHRPDARGEARHRAERHRPGARPWASGSRASRSSRRWRR